MVEEFSSMVNADVCEQGGDVGICASEDNAIASDGVENDLESTSREDGE